ncbi:MAG: hypothetical protein ACE5FY_01415 [Nitrospiria bacterium]
MELEYLSVLESRVQQMISLIKQLREEKQLLENKLNEQQREFEGIQQERANIRDRVERILETINHLESGGSRSDMSMTHSSMETTLSDTDQDIRSETAPDAVSTEHGGGREAI